MCERFTGTTAPAAANGQPQPRRRGAEQETAEVRVAARGVRWLMVGTATVFLLLATGCAASPAAAPAATPGAARPAEGQAALDGEPQEAGEPGENGQPVPDAALPAGTLIVRTGHLRLEVSEIPVAVDAAARLVAGLGGYVAASEEENTGSEHSATITYRIPSARWDEVLRGLRALAGRVINEQTDAAEVTAQVVDLDARIANLRASEATLQEIMTRSGTIEEVLLVQRELSDVRGQIEQLTAQRDHLHDQASYGTLTVSYEMPVVAVNAAQEGWDLGTEIDRAVAQLVTIAERLSSLGIWLAIVVLPIVGPFVLVGWLAYRFSRRSLKPAPPTGPIDRSV